MTAIKVNSSNFTRADWIELRHGDILTPFQRKKEYLKFIFECYWGISKNTRERDDNGNLVHNIVELGFEAFDTDQQVKRFAQEADKKTDRELKNT